MLQTFKRISPLRMFLLSGVLSLAAACSLANGADIDANTQAKEILAATGVQGGLVVHVGCGDGKVTAALRPNERYLVHGLARDRDTADSARAFLHAKDLYGPIAVDVWNGDRLPYTDNLVNLLVVEDGMDLSANEIQRVLCPRGVAYVRGGDAWKKTVKPWPDEIDEWTHYLHNASNNAVAQDTVVGPPHHLQWIGGPKWARGHEVLATVSLVISGGGRVFYIVDEGATSSVDLPSDWKLVARDAFNGVLLWKRDIPEWESRQRPFRSGPTHLSRRLVAEGDEVYVTLGFGQPVVALNAATGEIRREYAGSNGTEEILFDNGALYFVAGDPDDQKKADLAVRRGQPMPPVAKRIIAVQTDTGQQLWQQDNTETADLFAQTLAVGGGRAVFQNTRAIVCLDAKSGEQLWRTKRPAVLKRPAWSVPTVVLYDDLVISADRQGPSEAVDDSKPQRVEWSVSFQGGQSPPGELVVYSAETGQALWGCKCREGYNAPVDVLLADGLLWTGELVKARDPGITAARDPKTGEVKRTRPNDQTFFTPGMSHHRCYRNRATERFVLMGRSGVELLDLETGKATANHWIRGTCQYGVMPANGMIYVPPHTCACYVKTKLNGFNALAPKRDESDIRPQPNLEKGPAFASTQQPSNSGSNAGDWPTYRHDAARSGATATEVPSELKPVWNAEVGGKLSSVVIADNKVFVARLDTHSVHALDAGTGKDAWSFTAGGTVDSPPTIYNGTAIFGSADGWVYCVRASDGELVWRFRGGPVDRRVMIDGKLESALPIHGSVLVQNDLVYFAVGRSSFLDGGIRLFALNPVTGEVVHRGLLSGRDPKTGEQPKGIIKGFDMPSGLPDVLSGRDGNIYMRDLKFDGQCAQSSEIDSHLFSPTGFLDDSWWHRSYWLLGSQFKSGWPGWHQAGNQYPAGRILAFNDEGIYGFGRNMYPTGNAGQWKTGEYYRFFAASRELKEPPKPAPKDKRGRRTRPKSLVDYRWSYPADFAARALVLAGDTIFAAGPNGETHRSPDAYEGKEGISLRSIEASSGKPLATIKLDSLPVFDGMAAAAGRLFLSKENGRITCFAGP